MLPTREEEKLAYYAVVVMITFLYEHVYTSLPMYVHKTLFSVYIRRTERPAFYPLPSLV